MTDQGLSMTDMLMTSTVMVGGGFGEKMLKVAHNIDAGSAAARTGVVQAVKKVFGGVWDKFTHPGTDHPHHPQGFGHNHTKYFCRSWWSTSDIPITLSNPQSGQGRVASHVTKPDAVW